MKSIQMIGATALLLFFGFTVPIAARQDRQDKSQKEQQQAKPQGQQQQAKGHQEQQAKPQGQQQQAKPQAQQRQAQSKPQAQPQNQSAKPQARQQTKSPQQNQSARPAGQQQQANSTRQGGQQQAKPQARQEQAGNRNNQQPQQHAQRSASEVQRQREAPALRLSARGQGRIPDDRFRSNFGSSHRFRIGSPMMVGGYSRFQYGGYWFGFVEPWPEGWYYTDDVYVDYVDDGYYLFNPYDPGIRIAINVVL